jgi:hypothetical protein
MADRESWRDGNQVFGVVGDNLHRQAGVIDICQARA